MNGYRLVRRADRWLDHHPALRDFITVAIILGMVLWGLHCCLVQE